MPPGAAVRSGSVWCWLIALLRRGLITQQPLVVGSTVPCQVYKSHLGMSYVLRWWSHCAPVRDLQHEADAVFWISTCALVLCVSSANRLRISLKYLKCDKLMPVPRLTWCLFSPFPSISSSCCHSFPQDLLCAYRARPERGHLIPGGMESPIAHRQERSDTPGYVSSTLGLRATNCLYTTACF